MKQWKTRAVLIAGTVLLATPALAAKWVQISTIEYLDTDSVQRTGDEVTYNIFTVVGDARPTATTEGVRYRLNCKTREETADFPGADSELLGKDEPIYVRLCKQR